MSTELIFRDDAYVRNCSARVVGHDDKGVILDRTVFYATSGGQPGDTGTLRWDGGEAAIVTANFLDPAKTIVAHQLGADAALPPVGTAVEAVLDWEPRYLRMQMHSALHLLSVALPYAVTGGSIGTQDSRLDFDIQDAGLDRDAIGETVNELIARDAAIRQSWITDAELDANPGLVKTMSVQPPRGSGRIRLIEIDGIDLQPCGGTHVRSTGEIGRIVVTQIEKKGKANRRVRIAFAPAASSV